MAAQLIDGKAIANEIRTELTEQVAEFIENNAVVPCLAAVLVGEDPASEVYVRNKQRACERVGIEGRLHRLPADATDDDLLDIVAQLNQDNTVHGILVQLPLPKQLSETRILDAIHPLKDVDAFHPENVGLLSQGRPRYLPCTPHGVMQLLHRSGIEATGKHAVIVGRSDIVGKPMAMLLAARDSNCGPQAANATVTLCHSRSQDMASLTRQADILVAAVGIANFIQADMVKPGAAVIDVGINRTDEGLVGDVAFDPVSAVAGHITPVPGGVGPLTVTMLLHNTLTAAGLQLHSA
ncbi:MAG TPA: bifunctional methylenetetrahydrofolate dehydrogenase/methenyltetrahydrofolate cyclohydrolase FolD [Planctomycetaceae bacterium]|nr:bifunctional methylenetetrahydrofolate dehydrogenase/methenyltetrahydrofolate cyclohydrolase FolD [Blastopirellula sp.]HAY78227.1 bifunctional methylenetetrahydrofolate dehydrogenase/methenyltetrahydrofolate cyclohydrolase FolD [Planctomycetaceae bacterium]